MKLMKVIVKFFASTKEMCGCSSIIMEIPTENTTKDLIQILLHRFPLLQNGINEVSLAVNKQYITEATALKENDEVF